MARPLTWLSTLGLTVLLPRYLGDVNLGRMNFAFAFADWCGLLASFGIATYLTKEVARRPLEAAAIVFNALVLRAVMAIAVGTTAVVVAALLPVSELTRTLIYLLTLHMLLMVVGGVIIGGLQGAQELRSVAVIDAVSKVLQLGLIATVLFMGFGPIAVAAAYVAGDLLMIAFLLRAILRKVGLHGPLDRSMWVSLFRGGAPFLVWETALLTYARVDVVILSLFAHDAVLGWYSAAYRIISLPLFLPVIIMTAVFPALSASSRDPATFNNLARRAIQAVALTTVPMSLGLMLIAGALIRFFGYPGGFDNSVGPLVLLSATLPLVGINMILGCVLAARDRQRQWAIAGVAAAVLNVSVNFVAIPYTQAHFDNGAIGAAAVTSLTEVMLLGAGLFLCPRGVFDSATVRFVLRCGLAALVMAVLIWPLRDGSVLLTVPFGALVFLVAAFATRAVSSEDVRALRAMLARRGELPPEPATF